LSTVLRTPAVALTVAGRTDAGVHATGQVAHVDVPPRRWAALPGRASGRSPAQALLARLGRRPAPGRAGARAAARPGGLRRALRCAVPPVTPTGICDDPAGVPPLRRHDVAQHRRPLDAPR
jgi:tRNA pseudouridine38-40 synthase